MNLIFLGTGAGAPSRKRNVSGIVVRFDQSRETWLVDCGEGTQHQFLRAPVSAAQVTHVLLTHLHGDHVFGLPGFLSSRSLQGGSCTALTIVGPKGAEEFVTTTLRLSQTKLGYGLNFVELAKDGLAFDHPLARVECALLNHPVPCYGYAILLPDKPGRFNVEKAIADGILHGPHYGLLKQGLTITLADGRTVDGKAYIDPTVPGKKVVILGDTSACQAAVRLAEGADLLIHEATFSPADAKLAAVSGHSTTLDAVQTALAARVKALALTHISARYDDEKTSALLAEAKSLLVNTVLAEDLIQLSV